MCSEKWKRTKEAIQNVSHFISSFLVPFITYSTDDIMHLVDNEVSLFYFTWRKAKFPERIQLLQQSRSLNRYKSQHFLRNMSLHGIDNNIPDRNQFTEQHFITRACSEQNKSAPGLLLKGETLTQVTWKKPQQINQSSSARIIVPQSSSFRPICHIINMLICLPGLPCVTTLHVRYTGARQGEVREWKVMPFNGRHYQTVLDTNNYI